MSETLTITSRARAMYLEGSEIFGRPRNQNTA